MKLYRGIPFKTEKLIPTEVHSDDFHKFKRARPLEVIWAYSDQEGALLHALLYEYTFSRYSNLDNNNIPISATIKTENSLEEIFKDKWDEKLYLYELDSTGFKNILGTNEYYSTKEITPLRIKEYSRKEVYEKLKKANYKFE